MVRISLMLYLCLFLTSGCSDTILATDTSKPKSVDHSQSENVFYPDTIDEPVSVSGAFLYCNDSEVQLENEQTIGCRIENKDRTKRTDIKVTTQDIEVTAEGNILKVYDAVKYNLQWHWLIPIGDLSIDQLRIKLSARFADLDRSRLPIGLNTEDEPPPREEHIMFYTEGTYQPVFDFNGAEAGDQICKDEAAEYLPQKEWKAVLNNGQQPFSLPVAIVAPVVNREGEVLSTALGPNFWNGPLENRILPLNPNFPDANGSPLVWTGIIPNNADNFIINCGNWQNPDAMGAVGRLDDSQLWLDDGNNFNCRGQLKLLCISQ